MDQAAIGKFISQCRKQKYLTQAQLAECFHKREIESKRLTPERLSLFLLTSPWICSKMTM